MTAFNVVRFRVKPDREQEFLDAHRNVLGEGGRFAGSRRFVLIQTGSPSDRMFCAIGEWDSFENIVAARPEMIAALDSFRDTLEDLGEGLGVTDPVSGEAVIEFGPPPTPAKRRKSAGGRKKAPAKRARPAAKRKAAKRPAAKKTPRKAAAKHGRKSKR